MPLTTIRKQQGGFLGGDQAVPFQNRWPFRLIIAAMLACAIVLPGGKHPAGVFAQSGSEQSEAAQPDTVQPEVVQPDAASSGGRLFLPVVVGKKPPPSTPLIHIPFFNTADVFSTNYSQMAVFWFGKVSPSENYTHVRMGYNSNQLWVEVNVYDQQVWYDDRSPSANEVANWDATSLYFQLPANSGGRLFRFDSQLSTTYENRAAYQAVYERSSGGWTRLNVPFSTKATYRGEGINNAAGDKGWITNIVIPFSSLGINGTPAHLSEWKMGMRVYDQDSGPGGLTRTQTWPAGFTDNNADNYSTLTFGFPSRGISSSPAAGSVTIKQGPGISVPDGSVGGHSTCGGSADYWSEWGNLVYDQGKQAEETVVQNQNDVSDFPCFSRYYVTFPLNAVPQGKVILSARLTLYQFGNSDPSDAKPSYIQVFRVNQGWSETTLSWNNSPQVQENFPGIWVDPLKTYPGVPGVARTWDVTQALLTIMQGGSPQELRLALQSGDWAMHSGKYFWSSETAAWSQTTPPRLVVTWANP
jgi:hypothetical protein